MNASLDAMAKRGRCLSDLASRALEAFVGKDEGVTAIEYALIASVVVLVVLTGIVLLGSAVERMWLHVATEVAKAV